MKRVIVWGMGKFYERSKCWLKDVDIIAFVNDGICSQKEFEGKPIIHSSKIIQMEFDQLIIAVGSIRPIYESLNNLTIDKRKIVRLGYKEKILDIDVNRKKVYVAFANVMNVGDLLNSFLFDNLFNIDVEEAPADMAEMIAIGSILEWTLENESNCKEVTVYNKGHIDIWGTGFMYRHDVLPKFARPVRIHALRGELTKNVVEKMLNTKLECVLADPGLLVSLVYRSEEKKYDFGIVPHYVDKEDDAIKRAVYQCDNSVIIDVREKPSEVIRLISQCKVIISTSLHGLIIADSFGIPNQWCICSDKILGDNYKFYDYYSSYGLTMEPVDLNKEIPKIEDIIWNYRVDHRVVKQKQQELIRCFPYNERR